MTDRLTREALYQAIQGALFTPEGSVLAPNPTPRVKLVQTGDVLTNFT